MAATTQIFFGASAPTLGVGSTFDVGVFVNSATDRINAVEGDLIYDRDLLELVEVHTGGSVISLWMEEPGVDEDGIFRFQGITPGGFQGERGELFVLTFKARASGAATVTTANERILLHDGLGTETRVERAPLSLTLSETLAPLTVTNEEDIDTPEAFIPQLVVDGSINNGALSVVFETQDKGTGVERYELQTAYPWTNIRSFFGASEWQEVHSPYMLDEVAARQIISIKAVDGVGNEYVGRTGPLDPPPLHEHMLFYGILFVTLISFAVFGRRIVKVWGKSKR